MVTLPMGLADALLERLNPTQSPWVTDPVGWATTKLDDHLWSTQRDIAQSVVDNPRTAVKACHGPGKALALDTPLPTPTGWTTMGGCPARRPGAG